MVKHLPTGKNRKPLRTEPTHNGIARFLNKYTMGELTTGIESLKYGKAGGMNDLGTELIMHFGMSAKMGIL